MMHNAILSVCLGGTNFRSHFLGGGSKIQPTVLGRGGVEAESVEVSSPPQPFDEFILFREVFIIALLAYLVCR